MNTTWPVSFSVPLRVLSCVCLTQSWPLAYGQSPIEKLLHSAIPVFAASATDGLGNVYVARYTTEDVISTTPGAFQRQFVAGPCSDGVNGKCAHSFVMKIAADGASVMYATYLGGRGTDLVRSIVIDSSGGAYVTGSTTSLDFPVSGGANRSSRGPGFIARISPDGSALSASTYLSGEPWKIALDPSGNVYAAGVARTQDFKTTAGAFQTAPQGGLDAFALKMDAKLGTLSYSTLLGGGSDDIGYALAVDSEGYSYVGGFTASKIGAAAARPFPVTAGAYVGPGGSGAFVTKISPDGSRLIFASILGDGFSHEIVVDSSQNVYIGGGAGSGFVSTAGAFTNSGEGFAAKLSSDGARLIYATRLPSYSAHVFPQMYSVSLVAGDHLLVLGFEPATDSHHTRLFSSLYRRGIDRFLLARAQRHGLRQSLWNLPTRLDRRDGNSCVVGEQQPWQAARPDTGAWPRHAWDDLRFQRSDFLQWPRRSRRICRDLRRGHRP